MADFAKRTEPLARSSPVSRSIESGSALGEKWLALLAWFIVGYNVAVILWGAYVRATGSGAGCGSRWPLCNGELLPSAARSQTVIEFTHRITSALSLITTTALVIWCWRRTSKGDWPRYSAACAILLLFNEALLGALLVLSDHVGMDRSAAHAAFLCLHFVNTLLLLAALTLTAKWLSHGSRRFAWVAKPYERTVVGLGLLSVMAIGMTGSLAALADTIFPMKSLQQALKQDFSANGPILLRLRIVHPIAAVIGCLYLLWMLLKFWENGRSSWRAPALTVTLMAQLFLGVANVILLAPIWLQMVHLLVAEVSWILVVAMSADLLFAEQPFGIPNPRPKELIPKAVPLAALE